MGCPCSRSTPSKRTREDACSTRERWRRPVPLPSENGNHLEGIALAPLQRLLPCLLSTRLAGHKHRLPRTSRNARWPRQAHRRLKSRGLASIHATTLLQAWRSGCHDLFVFMGLMARGAHPGRRSPSDRLGKWSGADMRSAISRRLRDGAVEQGLTRPCCCICAQAEASPHPGKGASSCSAGELRIIRSSSEALASGPKLVQRTIERSHLLRREPSSEREPPRRHC